MYSYLGILHKYSRTPLIWTLVIRITDYTNRLGPSSKFVENSRKLTCLEITGYGIYTAQCYGFQNFKSGLIQRLRRKYIPQTVTGELQPANVPYFQRKIQLSAFSAHPNASSSQLIRRSAVLLYKPYMLYEYPMGQICSVAISTCIFAKTDRANICSSLAKQELVIQTKLPFIQNTFNTH